jgi:hypothetical protein
MLARKVYVSRPVGGVREAAVFPRRPRIASAKTSKSILRYHQRHHKCVNSEAHAPIPGADACNFELTHYFKGNTNLMVFIEGIGDPV